MRVLCVVVLAASGLGALAPWSGGSGAIAFAVAGQEVEGGGPTRMRVLALLALPVGLVSCAVLFLVVRRTGRPRWAIPRTFRGMSEGELVEWFEATA